MGIVNVDLNNISLGINFDKDDTGTINLIKLSAWRISFGKRKEL